MNVLIDTCIIIDALQSREPFNKDAEAVFLSVANRRCVGFLTANSITDIYYLMHKALHSAEETKKVLGVLFSLFEILDTCGIDCRRALASDISDYEDAVMIEAARPRRHRRRHHREYRQHQEIISRSLSHKPDRLMGEAAYGYYFSSFSSIQVRMSFMTSSRLSSFRSSCRAPG